MNDFEERAIAASARIRERATELARTVDLQRTAHAHRAPRRAHARTAAVAAVGLMTVGLAGLIAIDRRSPGDSTGRVDIPTAVGTLVPTKPGASAFTSSTQPTSTQPTSTQPTSTQPASDRPPLSAPELLRPIIDPDVCESITADEGRTVIDRLTLFARPSELPVPIQVIGDPIDGAARPFALVQRFFDSHRTATGPESVEINGSTVWIGVYPNGNGDATWDLADGSQGYLRSRGLGRDDLIAIVSGLVPRAGDAAIPGFDFSVSDADDLVLLHEQMNTEVDGSAAGSQCRVAATGYVYRISALTGDPVYQFGGVIDRPVPLDVDVRNGTPIVISGLADPSAPSVDDVINADAATWLELRSRPLVEADGEPRPIGSGQDVVVKLVPVDTTATESYLTLRLVEQEGVPFLEIYTSEAVVEPGAEFFTVEINGRLRLKTTAHIGGVLGQRLAESPLSEQFTAAVSTVDGDDQVIQSTGEITLRPPS